MSSHFLLAIIVFGALLAIAIMGLLRANAAAARLHGSTYQTRHPTEPRAGAAFPDPLRR